MELQFINIKPNYRAEPEDMVKDIVAVKIDDVLYPLEKPDNKEIFIYGLGYKRIAKSKHYIIPRFSMQSEDWRSYREKYGDNLLYYSLTNAQLNDPDCCNYLARQEFISIRSKDLEHYMGFVALWNRFNYLQKKRLKEIYYYDSTGWICERKSIRPSFGWGPIVFEPSMNPVHDDDLLWEYGCELYHNECEKRGERVSLTHLLLGNHNNDYSSDTMKDFPVSVHDRMLYVFGEEMTDIYEQLLHYYK